MVSVATALDPSAVKAFVNDGAARYYGVDALVSYRLSTRWSGEANYSYLAGHDLNPTRPYGVAPSAGHGDGRYQPGGRIAWIGASAYVQRGAKTS